MHACVVDSAAENIVSSACLLEGPPNTSVFVDPKGSTGSFCVHRNPFACLYRRGMHFGRVGQPQIDLTCVLISLLGKFLGWHGFNLEVFLAPTPQGACTFKHPFPSMWFGVLGQGYYFIIWFLILIIQSGVSAR